MKKIPNITSELYFAAQKYLDACMEVKRLTPVIEKLRADVLAQHPVRYSDEFKPEVDGDVFITDYELLMMGNDDDLKVYWDALAEARREAGFITDNPHECPLLMAIWSRTQASREVLNEASYLTPHNLKANDWALGGMSKYREGIRSAMKFITVMIPGFKSYGFDKFTDAEVV